MAHLSIRGLDDKALVLKKRAVKEATSVNTLLLGLIDQGLGHAKAKAGLRRHKDLDALAGTWSKSEAAEFERATAAFNKVDGHV